MLQTYASGKGKMSGEKWPSLLTLDGRSRTFAETRSVRVDLLHRGSAVDVIYYEMGFTSHPRYVSFLIKDAKLLGELEKGTVKERDLYQNSGAVLIAPSDVLFFDGRTYGPLLPDSAEIFQFDGKAYVALEQTPIVNQHISIAVEFPYVLIVELASDKLGGFSANTFERDSLSTKKRLIEQQKVVRILCAYKYR